MPDVSAPRLVRGRDLWLAGSCAVFVLAIPVCGWLIWQGLFGRFIGFGGLLAVPLLVAGFTGTQLAGGLGLVLALVSYFRRGRRRMALLVAAINLMLAVIPIATFNVWMYQVDQARDAAQAALSPTERLFHLAITTGLIHRQQDVVALLSEGADINAGIDHARTNILSSAIIYQSEAQIVDLLVRHGADVNARTIEGWTPLHVAASAGKPAMVERLLEHGADRTLLTADGETALNIARQRLGIRNEDYLKATYLAVIDLLQEDRARPDGAGRGRD